MRIGHIELFVKDPLASRAFYEQVLGCEVVAVHEDRFVWLKLGEGEILLRKGQGPPAAENYQSAAQAIVFYTEDLQPTMQALRARGLVFEGYDGSEECPTFRDPDGHWFQLVAPTAKALS